MFEIFRKKAPSYELQLVIDELNKLKTAHDGLQAAIQAKVKLLEREQDDLHARYRRLRATQAGDESAKIRSNGTDLVAKNEGEIHPVGLDLRTRAGKDTAIALLRSQGRIK